MIDPRIIAIEGLDGTGKQTIAEKLLEICKNCGINAKLISFPRYDTQEGLLVKNYLKGFYGDPTSLSPLVSGALYTLDRRKYWLEETENHSEESEMTEIYILDRGFYSNFMYQCSKLNTMGEIAEWLYENYLLEIETIPFVLNHYLKTYYIELPESERLKQMENRSEKDGHEKNLEYMDNCRKFVEMSRTDLFVNSVYEAANMKYLGFDPAVIDYYKEYVKPVISAHGETEEEIDEIVTTLAQLIFEDIMAGRHSTVSEIHNDYGYSPQFSAPIVYHRPDRQTEESEE